MSWPFWACARASGPELQGPRAAQVAAAVFPSCERVRLLNTGSEATQAAIRLARTCSGRDKVLRFEGHFHGMHESIWFNHSMVSKVDDHGEVETNPDSVGFPIHAKDGVVNVVFNDVEAFEHALKKYKDQIVCVILEPISYNCGCLESRGDYLRAVREICTRENIVLIFDEVVSGLRMRPGSAQKYYGVLLHLTVMAKAIGGGMSIAAFGGKKGIMEHLNPIGKAAVSGTYSGALIPVLASVACLTMASEEGFYDRIEDTGNKLFAGIDGLLAKHNIAGHVRGLGARFGIYFGVENPEDDFDFRKVAAVQDKTTYKKFLTECVKNGLWYP
ncbi:aminotransferase class III-fold pyridoxal phosphate-dependent enzyme [Sinorhizobium americanum]|nr:aminotransferase class III-fold pyridoxal phosphate-dependent enzyme [Sinorhizobium americanum]